jgi:hypothetical protein
MKVLELISHLLKMPQDAIVAIPGYEDGYDDIIAVDEREVIVLENKKAWNGKYSPHIDEYDTKLQIVTLHSSLFR